MNKLKAIGFWILSFTWGLPLTLFGCLVAAGLLIAGYKPKKFHYIFYFIVPGDWGGFEAGPFFVVCEEDLSLKQHEAGHGLQNIMFGWLSPVLINIPSTIRYWYREWLVRSGRKKEADLPDYDSIWFEGMATRLGEKTFPCD